MVKVCVVGPFEPVRCKECGAICEVIRLRQGEGQPVQKIGGTGTVTDYHYYCACSRKEALVFFDGNSREFHLNTEFAQLAEE